MTIIEPRLSAKPHTFAEDAVALVTGAFLMSWGMVLLSHMGGISGGLAGVAFLGAYASHLPLGVVFFVVNLPFYVLAIRRIGWRFTIKTLITVALISVGVSIHGTFIRLDDVAPGYAATFAGLGIGMGLLVLFRHGASAGGFGILANYLQERYGWRAGYVQGLLDLVVVLSGLALVPLQTLAYSILGVVVLNVIIAMNHRPGRYAGTRQESRALRAAKREEVHPGRGEGRQMTDQSAPDLAAIWEARYAQSQLWSGKVNATTADALGGLEPGTALDVGCGEGGDVVWLAEHGWTASGVDLSPTAVRRGMDAAAERGLGDRVSLISGDLRTWEPGTQFDLVVSSFLHSPADFPRAELLRRTLEWVAPGGAFVSVSHAEPPPWASALHAHQHQFLEPVAEWEAIAPVKGWTVERADVVERLATSPDGEQVTLRDAVLVARRER